MWLSRIPIARKRFIDAARYDFNSYFVANLSKLIYLPLKFLI